MTGRHWFEDVADHLGPAYLRYSFTKGTEQEVDFLVGALGLEAGMEVLDVGCGPGRHAVELARRGIRVVGVDISERFLEVADERADAAGVADLVEFHRADARALALSPRFDAAVSLCQGAFGLGGPPNGDDPQNLAPDAAVLRGIHSALVPGGRAAVSAFSSYFQVRYLEPTDRFDAASAVNHERTELRDGEGHRAPAELWTTCYTPRELRLLAQRCGFRVDHIWSVTPGAYARDAPSIDTPEFLLVAHRPA
ncbi:MAG TPA: class I SAM-dependent methyltransferase [Microthrixaceae bacterium]|nr:class I SAM-dependent methyltransferase [Microthrixaceae bacterium]